MSGPVDRDEDDVDRDAILARRARFVATALVGLTVLPGCDPTPRPCLNIAEVPQAPSASAEPAPSSSAAPAPTAADDAGAPPQPCLDIAPPPPSASPAPSASASAKPDAGPPPPPPQPCLSVPAPRPSTASPPAKRKPAAQPCLYVAPTFRDPGEGGEGD